MGDLTDEMPSDLVDAVEDQIEQAARDALIGSNFHGVFPDGRKWEVRVLEADIGVFGWTWEMWMVHGATNE